MSKSDFLKKETLTIESRMHIDMISPQQSNKISPSLAHFMCTNFIIQTFVYPETRHHCKIDDDILYGDIPHKYSSINFSF